MAGKGGIIGTLIGSLAAVAGGFAFGQFAIKNSGPPADAAASASRTAPQQAGDVRPLAPVITNLREPPSVFVRLEAVAVLEPDTPDPGALVAKIGDDLVTYLRTVSLSEIEGPTGFQYLREDLRKRSFQLGGGKVRDFLLQSFVIQ